MLGLLLLGVTGLHAPSALVRVRPTAQIRMAVASVFDAPPKTADRAALKQQLLQLGAALDRGQSYNPTSGEYYFERMVAARERIDALIALADPPPTSLSEMVGEWELVYTTVRHGIFRSSPFFLAVQEAYAKHSPGGEPTGVDKLGAFLGATDNSGPAKANLFFRLHELQTCSWGASKIGRVAQRIDAEAGMLYSEFDTSIFSLTVIPILGWFKLLPTFGGCVVTASSATMSAARPGVISMVVEYTTGKKVEGLMGLGEWIWGVRVPVRTVWKLLPWNKGREPSCEVDIVYLDADVRIVRDLDGDCFVYTRPVVPRA